MAPATTTKASVAQKSRISVCVASLNSCSNIPGHIHFFALKFKSQISAVGIICLRVICRGWICSGGGSKCDLFGS
jgi:hypothetical protein